MKPQLNDVQMTCLLSSSKERQLILVLTAAQQTCDHHNIMTFAIEFVNYLLSWTDCKIYVALVHY